jgi:hypothetical protein
MDEKPCKPPKGQVAVFSVIILLVALRAASELGMMNEYGSDPQMPIWVMSMAVELALWFGGGLVAWRLVAARKNRWGLPAGLVLLLVWTVAICAASWEYQRARQALADASNPSTPPERLRELVHFDGIQAGYRLDNRLASNQNTPPEALRELSERDQLGTQMCLMRNPNTPKDILRKLKTTH